MTHQYPRPHDAAIAARRRKARADARGFELKLRGKATWTAEILRKGEAPSLRMILLAVEEQTVVHLRDMLGLFRFPEVVRARHIYFWLARELTKRSLIDIGMACGGKHHTTVLHAIAKVEAKRAYFEPELSQLLKALTPRGELTQ